MFTNSSTAITINSQSMSIVSYLAEENGFAALFEIAALT